MRKQLLVVLGVLSLGLGVAGILLPLLPTTPFLLLAAYLFARSSARLHSWLLYHQHLGPYIHAFHHRTGLTRTQKIRIGTSFTVLMGISLYFAPLSFVKCALAGLWIFWIAFLVRLRTAPAVHA